MSEIKDGSQAVDASLGASRRRSPILAAHSVLMLIFIYVPVLLIVIFSFNDSRINAVWQGFTWKWYVSLFDNRQVVEALTNSLIVAVTSTVVSTILGTMAAIGLRRANGRLKKNLNGLLYLPILVPDIIMGLSLLVLFSQFHFELGKLTVIIAHITFSVSYVYVIVLARMDGAGMQLEEASQDLGATPWQTFRHVTLPAIMPGVIAGAIMAFTLSIDDFMISFFVAGSNSTTLPIYIYGMAKRGISPEINALSTIMVVVTIILIILAERLRNQGTGKKKPGLPL